MIDDSEFEEFDRLFPGLYFDRQGRGISFKYYCMLSRLFNYYRVDKAYVHGCMVSTVWLGLNHNFWGGQPLIFETMVFNHDHRRRHRPWSPEGWMDRYPTEELARIGHERVVNRLRSRGWASLRDWH